MPAYARLSPSALPILTFVAASALALEAVRSPKIAVIGLAALALALIIFRNLLAGLVIFTILTFPEQLPGVPGVSLAKPVGALIAFVWLLTMLEHRELPFLPRDEPLLSSFALTLLAWALISAAWATSPGTAVSSSIRLAMVMVPLFVVYTALSTPRDLRVLLWAYLLAALATSSYALITGAASEGGRLTGGVINANFLAAELLVAMVMGAFMLGTTRSVRVRLLILSVLATSTVAFVLTQSRGGIVALAVGFVASIVVAGPLRPKVVATVFIVAALGVTYYAVLSPQNVRSRVTSYSQQSSSGRADEWRIALRMASGHPVAGIGMGNFPVVEPNYTTENINLLKVNFALQRLVAHNTYLETLSELGLVGFGLLLGLIAAAYAVAIRGLKLLARLGETDSTVMARGMIAAATALLTAYFFDSAQYQKQLWLVLGILAGIGSIARTRSKRAEEELSDRGEEDVAAGEPAPSEPDLWPGQGQEA
jgi:O-antigen ligase